MAAFAAGCSREQSTPQMSDAELTRAIEEVAELKPPPKPGELPIRLVPLKRADLGVLARGPGACFLFRGDRIYFATTGEQGIIRIDGRPTPVLAAGPVGPTGGFFRGGEVRVSIGRTGRYAGRAADYVPGWLAEVAVRAHREAMPQYATASWTCRRA